MSTYVETDREAEKHGTRPDCCQRDNVKSDAGKKRWLQEYSSRLLGLWFQWQTPLGVASAYTEQIKNDLAEFYEDPLKRTFIEATYCSSLSSGHGSRGDLLSVANPIQPNY